MQSFRELTGSPDALQVNERFFSAAADVCITEIREPGAQSSGQVGPLDPALVDEQMQAVEGEKERDGDACGDAIRSICTSHQLEMADPAMDQQVGAEILDQFHLRLYSEGW